jgi:hypothetical protein
VQHLVEVDVPLSHVKYVCLGLTLMDPGITLLWMLESNLGFRYRLSIVSEVGLFRLPFPAIPPPMQSIATTCQEDPENGKSKSHRCQDRAGPMGKEASRTWRT